MTEPKGHSDITDHETLLTVESLSVEFESRGRRIRAVEGASWSIAPGRTLALVGESGCGKSVTALSILRLIDSPPGRITGGRILFEGIDLLQLPERRMRRIRGNRIAMIFQEPMNSLNPVFSCGRQVVEAIELHQNLRGRAAWTLAEEMFARVGIPDPARRVREFPHQMSGGMRQRVMIAMALACKPALLIADEPTTALDVTIQAQILDLLASLQRDTDMSILLITHDLGIVARYAHDVCVMYAGRVVERAPVLKIFDAPLHPYTQALLRCVPRLSQKKTRLETIPLHLPDPENLPTGCRFHPRCPLAEDEPRCRTHDPALEQHAPDHWAACFKATASDPSQPASRVIAS